MGEGKNILTDILGIKPIGEAALVLTKASVDAAAAFLSKLCMPATEELGLMLRDVVSWRRAQAVAMLQRAEAKMKAASIDPDHVKVLPRLGIAILDEGSWTDDDALQDMWAGLLVSAATPDGRDESNLMFTDLLGRLTSAQARVLAFLCEKAEKGRTRSGLIVVITQMVVPLDAVRAVSELADIQQVDRELDHMRTLGLIDGGISPSEAEDATTAPPAEMIPTALALQMYARCRGARDLLAFYGLGDTAPVKVVGKGMFGGSMVIRPTENG